jgi:hypothetical protein
MLDFLALSIGSVNLWKLPSSPQLPGNHQDVRQPPKRLG